MNNANTYGNIDELIARFFDGNASQDEITLIEKWKSASKENLKAFEDYLRIWESSSKIHSAEAVNVDKAWRRFEKTVQGQEDNSTGKGNIIHLFSGNFARIAAVALILIAVASVLYFYILPGRMNHVYTAEGAIQTIDLPDGSRVTLNASSEFSYPKKFNGDFRKVKLTGEAYFEITRNENQPFVISANGTMVKVLGTSFNVKAYELDDAVELIVNSGRVAFSQEGKENQILLEAGDMGIYSKADHSLIKSGTDDPNVFAWRTRELVFNNDKLAYVIHTLNSVYHANIKLTNAEPGNCTLTANFNQQSLEEVLEVIALALDLKINRTNGRILLSGEACLP